MLTKTLGTRGQPSALCSLFLDVLVRGGRLVHASLTAFTSVLDGIFVVSALDTLIHGRSQETF